MGERSIEMLKIFAKKIHVTRLKEKGRDSLLIGVEFNNGTIWYPRYIQNMQLFGELFNKEEYKYPQARGFKGKRMLYDALTDLFHGKKIEDICVKHRLPPPHDPLPVEYHTEGVNKLEVFFDA